MLLMMIFLLNPGKKREDHFFGKHQWNIAIAFKSIQSRKHSEGTLKIWESAEDFSEVEKAGPFNR
jgi:hypothetical protein